MEKLVQKSIDEFLRLYRNECENELSTLAYFHLYFFKILKEQLQESKIELDRKTFLINSEVMSNHIDKSPIVEYFYKCSETDKEYSCNCELGDLLLIFNDGKKRKAILIQVKFNEESYGGASSKNQIKLYKYWPEFRVKKPYNSINNYGKKPFLIKKYLTSLCMFLTLFNKEKNFLFGDNSTQDLSFSQFLLDFLKFDISEINYDDKKLIGRHFFFGIDTIRKIKYSSLLEMPLEYKIVDDWDYFITQVLEYFSDKFFENKSINTSQNNKQISTILYFLNNRQIKEDVIFQDILNGEYNLFSIVEFKTK